jgi:hypothetical protein
MLGSKTYLLALCGQHVFDVTMQLARTCNLRAPNCRVNGTLRVGFEVFVAFKLHVLVRKTWMIAELVDMDERSRMM